MDTKGDSDIQKDEYLKECAEKLLYIKLSNNRSRNNLSRVQNDTSYENKREFGNVNFESEKYLEELKKREFSLDVYEGKEITQRNDKINSIDIVSIKDNTRVKKKEDKNKGLER